MRLPQQWSLRHIIFSNLASVTLILLVGGMLILMDIRSAEEYNQENIIKLRESSTQVGNVVGQFKDLINSQLPLRQMIASQEVTSQQVKHEIVRFVIQDEESTEPLLKAVDHLNLLQEQVNTSWSAELPQEPLATMQSVVGIINDIAQELYEIRSPSQLEELAEDARNVSEELVTAITQMRSILDDAAEHVNESVIQSGQSVVAANRSTIANAEELNDLIEMVMKKTFGIVGMVIVLIIVLQVIIFVVLRRRLASSLEVIDQLSQGDLTLRLDATTNDEIGQMLAGFNTFIESIQVMIREIIESGVVLIDSSHELSTISTKLRTKAEAMLIQSERVASSSEEMSGNLASMATASEEMSANTSTVSATIEEMSSNVNTVAVSVEEMSVSIGDIAQNARNGAMISEEAMSMSREASNTMNTLGDTARDIGKVTEVIKGIAEQTNLLALNATIEAAAAGDAGKGFAVVASEIKELANQSARAAKDITTRVEGVQKNTKNAIGVIAEVTNTINGISDSAGKIAGAVEEQTRAANEISANVVQTGTGSTHIASSVTELAKATNEMSKNTSEVAEGANRISASIQKVTEAALDSNTEAHQVNNSAEVLSNFADRLQQLMERFKVDDDSESPIGQMPNKESRI
jgi:methyl-accepting chemotaxis protein